MSTTRVAQMATQEVEETPFEAECRRAGGFNELEKLMPQRWEKDEIDGMDKLTSLLGKKNPFYKCAHPKEHSVWILDNVAYKPVHTFPHKSNPWHAEFVACFFGNSRKDISKKVAAIADAIGIDGKQGIDPQVTETIAKRLLPFCSAIAPARTVAVKIPCPTGPPHVQELGPSKHNGISVQTVLVGGDEHADGTVLETTTVEAWDPPVKGKTRFVGPEGWAIISDIDDTIKYTQTSQAEGILRTTFCDEPRVIEDMPALYAFMKQQFNNPAYFYLSASPYNLYPFLHDFLEENYPGGTLILRDNSWQNLSGLFKALTQGVQAYKVSRMDKIHDWIPKRKMICVGDSTQSDPEAYAEIYHKYPGWIQAIFIRKVTNIPNMEAKNKDTRFSKAFKGVPEGVWQVFEKPEECEDRLKHLTGTAHPGFMGTLHSYFCKEEKELKRIIQDFSRPAQTYPNLDA